VDEAASVDETSRADEILGDDEASGAVRVPATTRRSGWPAWAGATRIKVPLAEKHASPLAATPDTAPDTAPEAPLAEGPRAVVGVPSLSLRRLDSAAPSWAESGAESGGECAEGPSPHTSTASVATSGAESGASA
jgi:hypothetical protein